ncbi:DUF3325 family protein [Sphingomonas sp. GC_Shp_3]|uniref:DUF3325 family protein n=1 Tax=Sphingomonas sp. GC_Shp_3 TaxID=2937383 RepID=UPI00226A773E|nr:DUF3325 family protein [Sphingomonas sp. GC_Shp_3]
MLIASAALLYLALFALAIAQPQHGDVLTGRRLAVARQQQARFFGWVLLAASLAIVLVTAQPVYATLWWIGALPAVGLPLVAARSYRPEFARAGAAAAVVAVPFGLILAAI